MTKVHLMGRLCASGMERMFVSAAPYMLADGDQIILCQGLDHPYREELVSAGYGVLELPSLKSFRGLFEYIRIIRRLNPELLHIHTEGAFVFAVFCAKLGGLRGPIIRTVHNVFVNRASKSVKLQAILSDRYVDEFVAPSKDVADNEQALGRNCRVIANWVDSSFLDLHNIRSAKATVPNPSVVMVGNSSPIKNQIAVLRPLCSSLISLYFHGSETGATQDEREILDSLERDKRLLYRGRSEPSSSLLNASAFVMPSLHEGMPVALAEALAVGVTCVLADVPGMQWAHGLPGVYFVGPDGDYRQWSEVLTADWCNAAPVYWERSSLLDFSAVRGAQDYLDLYRALLAFRQNEAASPAANARRSLFATARRWISHPIVRLSQSAALFGGRLLSPKIYPFDGRAFVGPVPFEVCDLSQAVDEVLELCERAEGVPVRLANAYCVALASKDRSYRELLNGPGFNLPDGMPVVWTMRFLGNRAGRVRGPSLFQEVIDRGQARQITHFFLGTTEETLTRLTDALLERYPEMVTAGCLAPAFGPLSEEFFDSSAGAVSSSGADIVWLALGSPKQDFAAAELAERVGLPCIGVGAAFDFTAGTVREAPRWMQSSGVEWLFRFASEPRRLWRRYVFGNVDFLRAVMRRRGGES